VKLSALEQEPKDIIGATPRDIHNPIYAIESKRANLEFSRTASIAMQAVRNAPSVARETSRAPSMLKIHASSPTEEAGFQLMKRIWCSSAS
jgi:hypothetical protein